jgi:tartrate/fumarate subfamily iron-sulfur-dependent hydro-lyase beta chain
LEDLELKTPLMEEKIRKLRVGDVIYLTGTLMTARDRAHKRIKLFLDKKKKLPFSFYGLPLYHCGPLVRKVNNKWVLLAAGPTTSKRMELYEEVLIKNLGVKLIIGKGGMGEKTRVAMKEYGIAYGAFTGGAAVLAANKIIEIKDVKWLELGLPDAVWIFKVKLFGPIIISMDSYGKSLYK